MSEVKKIATRESYGNALAELGKEHEDVVVLDADLSKSTMTVTFKKEFPERFYNMGIAEANMINVAAGLATMGLVPFAATFAMFAAGRAYEQVRNTVGYPHLNVKIGATHGGISVGEDGASHQCCEDFALMRSIPGMVVMSPADDVETKAMVWAAYEHQGPVYMRFSRYGAPVIHDADRFTFEIGKGEVLREGSDVALIANGLLVAEALEAAELLAQQGISARVIDMATIKPLDEGLVLKAAKECGRLVTCEEHSIIGGLGEAVCAVIAKHGLPCPVERIGVNDEFGHSGPAAALLERLQKAGIRAKMDDSDQSMGWKAAEYEMKGVPLRVEIGPKDMEKTSAASAAGTPGRSPSCPWTASRTPWPVCWRTSTRRCTPRRRRTWRTTPTPAPPWPRSRRRWPSGAASPRPCGAAAWNAS